MKSTASPLAIVPKLFLRLVQPCVSVSQSKLNCSYGVHRGVEMCSGRAWLTRHSWTKEWGEVIGSPSTRRMLSFRGAAAAFHNKQGKPALKARSFPHWINWKGLNTADFLLLTYRRFFFFFPKAPTASVGRAKSEGIYSGAVCYVSLLHLLSFDTFNSLTACCLVLIIRGYTCGGAMTTITYVSILTITFNIHVYALHMSLYYKRL